jgi:hypothetical protein
VNTRRGTITAPSVSLTVSNVIYAPRPVPTPEDIAGMSPDELKIYTNYVRRLAGRQGCRIKISRRQDPLASDYRRHELIGPKGKVIAEATSLPEIHAILLRREP